jgi:hypothetical protein
MVGRPPAPEQIKANCRQIGHNKRPRHRCVYARQQICPRYSTRHSGQDETRKQFPINVAVDDVADRRGCCREGFDKVDAGRGAGWRHAHHADEQCVGDDAERHPERAIDKLCDEPNRNEGQDRIQIFGSQYVQDACPPIPQRWASTADWSYKPSLCFPRPSIHLPRQFPLHPKEQTSSRLVGAQVMPWEGQRCSQRKAMPLSHIELDDATFMNRQLDCAEPQR